MKRLLVVEVEPEEECPYMEFHYLPLPNSRVREVLCSYMHGPDEVGADCNDKNCPLPKVTANPNCSQDIRGHQMKAHFKKGEDRWRKSEDRWRVICSWGFYVGVLLSILIYVLVYHWDAVMKINIF